MTNLTNMSNAALVDLLGALKAEQADLANRERALRAVIAGRMERSNTDELDGHDYRLTVSSSYPETLDTAALKAAMTPEFLARFMKRGFRSTWRVTARVAEVA